jgi:hypothetical protein
MSQLSSQVAALMCCLMLTSCAAQTGTGQAPQPAPRPIICSKGDDCDVKWGKALIWVRHNSAMPITVSTESTIATADWSTYDTPDKSVLDEPGGPSFTVLKTPCGRGLYLISLDTSCPNNFAGALMCQPHNWLAEFAGAIGNGESSSEQQAACAALSQSK